MWKKIENRDQFEAIIADLLIDPDVQALKHVPRHGKYGNSLDHSLYVAYISFLMCRRLGLDFEAAARGGLLHDFAIPGQHREETSHRTGKPKKMARARKLVSHPHEALQGAQERYQLTNLEKDIIVKHMWPLTRPLPRHKESFVVSTADKICAMLEMSRLHKAFRMRKYLVEPLAA